MTEPKVIAPKKIYVQKVIDAVQEQFKDIETWLPGVTEEAIQRVKDVRHFHVFRRNVTKENWYHYLEIADNMKSDDAVRFYFKHDKGVWKFYHVHTGFMKGTFVERWFWNEKEETLEGEAYLSSKQNVDEVVDLIFGL